MTERLKITKNTTVREINARYPQCIAVFEELGMAGCGGELGPEEPLWVFAAAHRIELNALIAKLEDAVENPHKYAVRKTESGEDISYFAPFVKASIFIGVFLGVAWGLYNLFVIGIMQSYESPPYAAVQAHGHAQFFGWVGLMIMGIAPFILPRFKNIKFRYTPALYLILWFMLVAIIAQALARPYAELGFNAEIVFGAGVLTLFAVLAWAWVMLAVYRDANFSFEASDLFIIAGIVWFVVAAALNLLIDEIILRQRLGAVNAPINLGYLSALSYGFAGNIIFGVAIRAFPSLLGLKKSYGEKVFIISALIFNAGIALRMIPSPLSVIGSILILLGGFLAIWGLRVFEGSGDRITIPTAHSSYRWLILYAFSFFLIGTGMLVGADAFETIRRAQAAHEFVGAFRHAITVGFITAMMIGVGYRILPVFAGRTIPSFALQVLSAWLLMIGNIWRIIAQLFTLAQSKIAFRLMPISGILELAAIAIFGGLIWWTLTVRVQQFSGEITENTRIADLLKAYPWARDVLVDAGLSHLAVVRTPPAFVTIRIASSMHGIDAKKVIDALNKAKAERQK